MNLNARAPMDILETPLLIVGHVSFHNDHYIKYKSDFSFILTRPSLFDATMLTKFREFNNDLQRITTNFYVYIYLSKA